MKSKIFTPRFIFVVTTIVLAAVSRLLPHIDNVTPVAAMALFGGVYLNDKRLAMIIPLLIMALSDGAMEAISGNGAHNTMIYVYASFAITSIIGILISKKISVLSVASASLVSSVLFFVITNFGVWASTPASDPGAVSLSATYILGIPFLRYTLLGDLFFNAVLFGAFYLAQVRLPKLVKA
jgi:hypothetical protein